MADAGRSGDNEFNVFVRSATLLMTALVEHTVANSF
jgi:hypothetical protein